MAAPTESFSYVYGVTPGTTLGSYQVNGRYSSNQTVQDYTDKNAPNDNLTQLGDINNDHFRANGVGEIYEGKTADGESFVASSGAGSYYLFTDRKYQGGTINVINSTASPFSVTCFASGTLICTARGDVAVEKLTIGDLVITTSGARRLIRWLGHRTFDCRAHPQPEMVCPIRIAAGAFGSGRPYRDLVLSPHHAVAVTCVNEVLIPIRFLVDGKTIAQVEVDEVTYWHLELESHDIVLANGLPAETYIDVGNRSDFEGQPSLTLHPEFRSEAMAGYCRPLVTGGPILSAVRAMLAPVIEDVPLDRGTFCIVADGDLIEPVIWGDVARFIVPSATRDLRLVSPSFVPRDRDASSKDDRALGTLVRGLTIDDGFGASTEVALDNGGLVAGFHPVERTLAGTWRWTDGNAHLSASLWSHCREMFVLRVVGQFDQPASKSIADAA